MTTQVVSPESEQAAVDQRSNAPQIFTERLIIKLKPTEATELRDALQILEEPPGGQLQSATTADIPAPLPTPSGQPYDPDDARERLKALQDVVPLAEEALTDVRDVGVLTDTTDPDLARWFTVRLASSDQEPAPLARAIPNERVETILEVRQALSEQPAVEYAELDYARTITALPNDPYYSSSGSWGQPYGDLWGLKKINVEPAWSITEGQGVTVAVVDTGVDYTHPDLAANIWTNPGEIADNGLDDDGNGFVDDRQGFNFADSIDLNVDGDFNDPGEASNPDPADTNGHGTHVAGSIAAVGNNNQGVVGVAPKATIMPLKALSGSGFGGSWELALAIVYAADMGADVINNSWGGVGHSFLEADAFAYARARGVVSVASAGNSDGEVSHQTPANIEGVIAVAATTPDDQKASFSSYGYGIDVAAPGGGVINELGNGRLDMSNILSTLPDTLGQTSIEDRDRRVGAGYYRLAGTSMAAPHVSGAAALIRSLYPQATPDEVRARLHLGADDLDNALTSHQGLLGAGRLNVARSLTVAPQPVPILRDVEVRGAVLPHESFEVVVKVQNLWRDAAGVQLNLTSRDGKATITRSTSSIGNLAAGAKTDNASTPLQVTVGNDVVVGETLLFDLAVTVSNSTTPVLQQAIRIPVSLFQDVTVQKKLDTASFDWLTGENDVTPADFNNDGHIDFFVGTTLYLATLETGEFQALATPIPRHWTMRTADVDNDGDIDVLVTGAESVPVQLFTNDGASTPTFTNISETAGLGGLSAQGLYDFDVAFIDFDRDGRADIFVPTDPCHLFHNRGGNQFVDITAGAGLSACRGDFQLLVRVLDHNEDGHFDLLLIRDDVDESGRPGLVLFENNGRGGFVLRDTGITGSFTAAAVGDYDNDGDPDLLVERDRIRPGFTARPELYRNDGQARFTDVTSTMLATVDPAVSPGYTTQWLDYDNDGDLDVYISDFGGHNSLLRNDGQALVADPTAAGARGSVWNQSAYADFDTDGDVDIVNMNLLLETLTFYENKATELSPQRWLGVTLQGTASVRDGLGAQVAVTAGGVTQTKKIVNTESLLENPLLFGVGNNTAVTQVRVTWPRGSVQTLTNLTSNASYTFIEGEAPVHIASFTYAVSGRQLTLAADIPGFDPTRHRALLDLGQGPLIVSSQIDSNDHFSFTGTLSAGSYRPQLTIVSLNNSSQVLARAELPTILIGTGGIPGDLNNDGAVTAADITIVTANFGKAAADADPRADANSDGAVTAADATMVTANFGR